MSLQGDRLTYTYTSQGEIQRLLSVVGADQWIDDIDGDPEEGYWYTECIEQATGTIDQYLGRLYDSNDMADSSWVRRRATYIAAYFFTRRRGNPGLFGEDYDRIIAELEEANQGLIQVPNLANSSGMLAVMQNVLVDQRFITNKSRVRITASTDTGGREPLAYSYPYDWFF